MTASASALLCGWPVTAEMNSSRSRAKSSASVRASTVAVRRAGANDTVSDVDRDPYRPATNDAPTDREPLTGAAISVPCFTLLFVLVSPFILAGEPVGTYFAPKAARLTARKRWIAFAVPPQGKLTVDAGALQALTQRGKSLLPSGILEVEGQFASGDVVALLAGSAGREFARGMVNFDADEVRKIRGAKTTEIEGRLGYRSFDEVIHRDNLVLL